ncbi:MAG: hypothetical protein JST11_08055 [Acidobacteria bacterium]|nr:hypothetical protein [Acidobacteriota bacterium]
MFRTNMMLGISVLALGGSLQGDTVIDVIAYSREAQEIPGQSISTKSGGNRTYSSRMEVAHEVKTTGADIAGIGLFELGATIAEIERISHLTQYAAAGTYVSDVYPHTNPGRTAATASMYRARLTAAPCMVADYALLDGPRISPGGLEEEAKGALPLEAAVERVANGEGVRRATGPRAAPGRLTPEPGSRGAGVLKGEKVTVRRRLPGL